MVTLFVSLHKKMLIELREVMYLQNDVKILIACLEALKIHIAILQFN